jgi:hypothetical protein
MDERDRNAVDECTSELWNRWFDSHWAWMTIPIVGAVLGFLLDWGGYRGHFAPWGDPRPFTEVWWHFPMYLAALMAAIRFLRFLDKRY